MSSRSLRRNRRAAAAGALAATLGFAGLGLASAPAGATADFDLERLAGADRIETAVEISQDTFTSATTALIARADLYPDALAGNYLAGAEQAPILLSHTGDVPAETLAELDRLGVTDVTLLGGTSALSQDVQDELEAAGLTVNREAGTDRYKTAAEIATSQDAAGIGEVDGARTAILATGERFPDALTGGPLAYAGSHPILLTPTASLGADAAGALEALEIEHVIILGGTAAVSQAAEDAVEAAGMTTERLAGATRYSTATEIAEWAIANAGFSNTHVDVATGQNFPDALTGGPHAGENTAPIILANDGNTAEAEAFLESIAATVAEGHIFGGTAAVSAAVEAALEAAGQSVAAGVTARPELVSAQVVDTNTPAELGSDGTTVAFTFDEEIATATNGTPPAAGLFNVYSAAGAPTAGSVVVSQSGTTVNVRFNAINSDVLAAGLTVATVDYNAVEDPGGAENPEGDAPLGTSTGGGEQSLAAGITDGPDLVSVGSFTADGANTEVAFTFDEAAAAGAAANYNLIPLDGSAPISGASVDGGTNTTTHIVEFTGTLNPANFARGTVDAGTVTETTDNELNGPDSNVLQAADISAGGNTADADLVSVQLQEGPATGEDRALFTFDENIATVVAPASLVLYKDDGTTVPGVTAQIDPGNATRVLVTYGEGAIDRAVGGQALAGAVTSVDPAAATNEDDEVGVANTGTTPGQTAGSTAGPDLTAVSADVETDLFGNVTGADATFTFDEPVTAATATEFFLFAATGERFSAISCLVPDQGTATQTDDVKVVCDFEGPVGDVDRPADAVLGTVDNGAVTPLDAGVSNPEGAAVAS